MIISLFSPGQVRIVSWRTTYAICPAVFNAPRDLIV